MTNTRAQMAVEMFIQVPGGYVFRKPYQWPFKQCQHHLVNEAQKTSSLS